MPRGCRERVDGARGLDERTPEARPAPAPSTTRTRRLLTEINARLLGMRAAWDAVRAADALHSSDPRGAPLE